MLRVGIVGLGGMGRGRLAYYAQMADARVEAIADVRAEALRADRSLDAFLRVRPGEVRWYQDARELVSSDGLDMVDICLPTSHHKDAAVLALGAGMHVLCEKPMALTLEDCDAMIAASQRSGKILMIAQCIRFWPEYEYLTALRRSGGAGRLLSLQLWREGSTPRQGGGWMRRADLSGGAILDLHIHDLDFCHYLLGLPQRVYAHGGRSAGPERGYDYVHTVLDYGPETLVSATAHWTDVPIPFLARYEARFERAFLRFDSSVKPSLAAYRVGSTGGEHPAVDGQDAYANELRYFVDCVLQGTQPTRCTAQQARDSVALVLRAKQSVERHTVVDV